MRPMPSLLLQTLLSALPSSHRHFAAQPQASETSIPCLYPFDARPRVLLLAYPASTLGLPASRSWSVAVPYHHMQCAFRVAKMAKEKKAKELKEKREQQAKELKEKREAEKQSIQVRAAAAAAAMTAGANPSAMGVNGPVPVRGGSSGDLAVAARQLGKHPARVESSELARMRLVQRTLVYVIGLSPRLAKEELLRRHEQKSLFNLFTMGPAFKFGLGCSVHLRAVLDSRNAMGGVMDAINGLLANPSGILANTARSSR